ncbi:MAG: SDR family oxidoreductase [Planctomycetia bacterium]|nr:SDR family oxidoreductase [Planctomycetia bacterium]
MSDYWKNKIVLITGGSSGLGRELAAEFAKNGARIILAALEKDLVESAVADFQKEGVDVVGFVTDVTSNDDVQALKRGIEQRFGRLDALVNVAGRTDRGKVETLTAEHVAKVMELNFFAMVRVTQTMLPLLLESRGNIINIGSLAAKAASRWTGAYPSSKFAVAAYSQQLRLELRERGVRTLLVCPGPIARETERLYPLKGLEDLPEEARRPGAGVKVSRLKPEYLVRRILRAAEMGKPDLVLPGKARLLFTICQLFPKLGDWLILRNT